MKDLLFYIFLLAVAFMFYFAMVMPIRIKLCEKHDMIATWYINGCVIKEK